MVVDRAGNSKGCGRVGRGHERPRAKASAAPCVTAGQTSRHLAATLSALDEVAQIATLQFGHLWRASAPHRLHFGGRAGTTPSSLARLQLRHQTRNDTGAGRLPPIRGITIAFEYRALLDLQAHVPQGWHCFQPKAQILTLKSREHPGLEQFCICRIAFASGIRC